MHVGCVYILLETISYLYIYNKMLEFLVQYIIDAEDFHVF